MQIEIYIVGPVQTNCYFVINEKTKEMLVIDPGASAPALIQKAKEEGLTPKAVLLTHGHFDHATGAEEFAAAFGIPIYAHEVEEKTLLDPAINLSGDMGGRQKSFHATDFLKDEQELDLAGFHLRVLFTPGHTPGGCCYYFPYEDTLFSGDTLFCMSVGRTDFPGGSMSQIVRSIKDKLLKLPDATAVYCGHGDGTTIETERIHNPYL